MHCNIFCYNSEVKNYLQEKIDTFFSQFPKHEYKKGQVLIHPDSEPLRILYLTRGQVKEYAVSKKGDELVVNIFKPFSFFPMSHVFSESSENYYFEALTAVVIRRVPKKAVLEFLHKEPDVLFDLLTRVYKGLDGVLSRMTYLMGATAYGRLVAELVICAKRFGQREKDGIHIFLSEKDLAASSGMSRETVSREMKKLKNKGLVFLSKNIIVVKNLEQLEEELVV